MISNLFILHASDKLGDTQYGLSGSKIAEHCSGYAIDFNIEIPYPEYPFPNSVSNKRTALRENLKAFNPQQQFQIIKELCELPQFEENKDVKDLRIKLISKYGHLSDAQLESLNETLIEETKHWLDDYPESLELYEEALNKFQHKIYQRNLLDDLRLSLETLLKSMLNNNKSLENQKSYLGDFIKNRKVSKELLNMFLILVDYYSKYQNTYVKHNNNVAENEIEIIFEMTCSFMKFMIRIQ